MKEPKQPTCEECCWWFWHFNQKSGVETSECRRRAPVETCLDEATDLEYAVWPRVDADMWCGDYAAGLRSFHATIRR